MTVHYIALYKKEFKKRGQCAALLLFCPDCSLNGALDMHSIAQTVTLDESMTLTYK